MACVHGSRLPPAVMNLTRNEMADDTLRPIAQEARTRGDRLTRYVCGRRTRIKAASVHVRIASEAAERLWPTTTFIARWRKATVRPYTNSDEENHRHRCRQATSWKLCFKTKPVGFGRESRTRDGPKWANHQAATSEATFAHPNECAISRCQRTATQTSLEPWLESPLQVRVGNP